MATRIVMPSFGMYTVEGVVARWLVEPGSAVEAGQPIVEITTEKASYELEAPAGGRFQPAVELDATLQVEGLIGWVLADGESVPSGGVGAAGVAGVAGVATATSGDRAGAPAPGGEPAAPEGGARPAAAASGDGRAKASPLARRLADELGVDLANVAASGPGGRIVEADVRAAAARRTGGAIAAAASGAGAPEAIPAASRAASASAPAAVPWRVRERIPLVGLRRAIAERLRQGQANAVALTLTREVEVGALVAARAALAAGAGGAPPWDALFVKALADALREQPELLAIVAGAEILRLDEVHVGFAVAVAGGLVVPVVRDADRRSLAEIATEVRALAARAREGRLAPADLLGGTATLTNLGARGVDAFTPVLNPPQSVILGVGRIADRPWAADGTLAIRPTCVLSLTFDHRVADGAPAADLLAAIARRLATWR